MLETSYLEKNFWTVAQFVEIFNTENVLNVLHSDGVQNNVCLVLNKTRRCVKN